jgi:class 3 adenylate cyclase/tetratricopeptide (TPR) repeat protein
MAACPSCGEANPARARFCLACGTPLVPDDGERRETRKTVTVVFCDVIDSTPLGELLDAETYRRVISRYFIEVSRVIERHGGTVEKFIGDAVMAVFGIPVLHEDDALRAVRSAAELREAVGALNEELRSEYGIELGLRTGINTGEVVAGDPTEGQAFATGEAVVVAQRLEAVASPGEILIGEPTQHLVRDAVLVEPVEPLSLKGMSQPVEAWRLLGVVSGAPAFARRLDSPLVGRERELTLLEQAFRRADDERACHMFTVLGAAGVGKSRLVNELVTSLGEDASVLIGRCVPYGEGITFWPLTELVRQAASIGPALPPDEARERLTEVVAADAEADLIVERLASATGLSELHGENEEIFWAVRKLLETVAQERPLIVAFDDLQWAEPTLLDLVDYLSDSVRNAPLLLVCLARPELLDERPTWGGGKLNATAILLEPLRDADVERLIENILGRGDVAAEVRRSLHEAGEGNPLFVEEMLAMLVDQGRLEREEGGWTADGELGTLEAPPTIQALLAARIDRLGSAERAVLERASVIGKLFTRDAVAALSPDSTSLDDQLAVLERKDLIRQDYTRTDSFRFRHILVRDAAYQGLAKEQRAELHEHYAGWLDEARPGRRREYEEILGYHLEQAHRFRSDLAQADESTRALASRAGELLGSSGRRAAARGDMPAAVGLLTRATLLLAEDEEARLELAPDLGIALIEVGELAQADGVLERAITAATERGDSRLEFRARLEHAAVRLRIDPRAGTEELRQTAEDAVRCFEELGDEVGLARAWLRLSDVHWLGSQWEARANALEEALVHARRAGHTRYERWILGTLLTSLLLGPTPMTEAIRRCEETLALVENDPVLEARVLNVVAPAKAAVGRFDEGREDYRRSRAILEELGHKLLPALGTLSGGWLELLAGDLESAEAELRWGCERLEEVGEKASLSTVAAVLGRVLYAQSRYEEAESFSDLSDAAAQPEDAASQAILGGTRAKILARRGSFEEAESLAHGTVSLIRQTDALNMQGDALMDLAEVLRLAGRGDDAAAAATEAVALYARKGDEVSRARAGAWLEGGS